jgi:hypothetical protein
MLRKCHICKALRVVTRLEQAWVKSPGAFPSGCRPWRWPRPWVAKPLVGWGLVPVDTCVQQHLVSREELAILMSDQSVSFR